MSAFNPTQRQIWRRILRQSLNLEDVKSICFDLDVEYEDLIGDTKTEKINSVLDTLFRENRLEPFRAYLLETGDYSHVTLPGLGELVGETPYVGLSAFSEESADNFFGREEFVAQLQNAIEKQPFVPVLGPSGSGKSSLIFAGLFPKVRPQPNWMVLNTRPGADESPLHSLVAALLNPAMQDRLPHERRKAINDATKQVLAGELTPMELVTDLVQQNEKIENVLLYIDQFEELFTADVSALTADDESVKTKQFLEYLIPLVKTTSRRVRLVILITMRADFLGHALGHPELADLLNHHEDVKLRPLKITRDPDKEDELSEIERVIILPAKNAGASFQDGVVERIIEDVGDGPGNLPLLQFALTELWNVQENGMLTHQGYDFIGQADGALVNHAEAVFADLSANEQQQARDLFTQLVQPGRGTTDTRRIANRDELSDESWQLAQKLSGEGTRLVIAGSDGNQRETVQVTHEALIANWDRLKNWMNADRAFREWQEQFRADAALWLESDHPDDFLYKGARLAQSSEQIRVRRPNLQEDEQKFIDASKEAAEAEVRAKEEAREQELEQARQLAESQERELVAQKRRSRVIRIALGIISLLLIGSVIATISAVNSRRTAVANAQLADEQRAEAEAQRAEAELQRTEADNQRAAAIDAQAKAETASELAIAESHRAQTQALMSLSTTTLLNQVNPSVEQAELVLLMGLQAIRNHGAMGGNLLTTDLINDKLRALAKTVDRPAWTTLIVGDTSRFEGDFGAYEDLAVTADSRFVLAAEKNGYIYLWDMTQPDQEPAVFNTGFEELEPFDVAVAPDGSFFATIDSELGIGLWTFNNKERPFSILDGHTDLPVFIEISADGNLLATAGWDDRINIWDVADPEHVGGPIATFELEQINSIAFSGDGKTVYATNTLNEFASWNTASGERLLTLEIPFDIYSVGASPASNSEDMVAIGGSFGQVLFFSKVGPDTTFEDSILLDGQISFATQIIFSADGAKLAAVNDDRSIFVWNTQDLGQEPIVLKGHTGIALSAVFLDNGDKLISGGEDDPLLLWDLARPKTSSRIIEREEWVHHVAWSPDGKQLAIGLQSGQVELINTDDLLRSSVLREGGEIGDNVRQLEYSPDGQWLTASINQGEEVRLLIWDMSNNGTLAADLSGGAIDDSSSLSGKFSPDGQYLAVNLADGLHIWQTGEWLADPEIISPADRGHFTAFTFAPSSDQIALSTFDNNYEVKLYNFPNIDLDNPIATFEGPTALIRTLAMSPDGRWMASGNDLSQIHVWDLQDPDSGSTVLTDHKSFIWEVNFSPDSQSLVSASDDNTVRVWDMNDLAAESQLYDDHNAFAFAAEYSPDGRHIASASADKTVQVWPTLDMLIEKACERVTRNMTQDEWNRYLFGLPYEQTCPNRPPHPSTQ